MPLGHARMPAALWPAHHRSPCRQQPTTRHLHHLLTLCLLSVHDCQDINTQAPPFAHSARSSMLFQDLPDTCTVLPPHRPHPIRDCPHSLPVS